MSNAIDSAIIRHYWTRFKDRKKNINHNHKLFPEYLTKNIPVWCANSNVLSTDRVGIRPQTQMKTISFENNLEGTNHVVLFLVRSRSLIVLNLHFIYLVRSFMCS